MMADGGGGFAAEKKERSEEATAALERLSRVLWTCDLLSLKREGPEMWKAKKDFYAGFKDWPKSLPPSRPMSDAELRAFMEKEGHVAFDTPAAKALYDEYHRLVKDG